MNNFQDCRSNMIHFTIIMLALFPWLFSAQGKEIPICYMQSRLYLSDQKYKNICIYVLYIFLDFFLLYYMYITVAPPWKGTIIYAEVSLLQCTLCWDTVHCTVAQQRVSEDSRPRSKHRTCSTHAPPISYFHPWASPLTWRPYSWDTHQPWATPHP